MNQFFEPAARLGLIPPYLFKTIDDKKAEVKARGVDIIDLGVGDPDLPTPAFIVQKMAEAIQDPETHRYPAYSGMNLFREAVARWYQGRFGVDLDPESEVLTLIGSKEGIAHLPLGINNPEDINLMTSPGYPVYQMGTLFAGAYCHFLPLTRENRFLPDLHAIPPLVARDAKAFFFNYPNNPTAAVADKEFFARVVDFCTGTSDCRGPRRRLHRTGLRRFQAPQFSGDARGQRDRHRVPFAVQDLQHDGVALRDGGGEPGGFERPGQDQEQHRFRGL